MILFANLQCTCASSFTVVRSSVLQKLLMHMCTEIGCYICSFAQVQGCTRPMDQCTYRENRSYPHI